MHVLRVRVNQRVRVRGRLPADATGTVSVTLATAGKRRTKIAPVVKGRFAAAIKRPRTGSRVKLRLSYSGDEKYEPRTLRLKRRV